MYLMDQKAVARNGDVNLHVGRPPIVVMTHRAAVRMRAFVMMSPIEVAGFGLLEHQVGKDSNGPDRLIVKDIHIMQQDCTAGSADITPQGFFELQDRLQKKYGKIMDKEMRVWWHSHAKIGIGWSGTDTGTMSEYTEDVDLLCLLTNRKAADFDKELFADQTLACYVAGPPARVAWNGLFIGVENIKEGETTQAILEEAIQDFRGAIRNLPTEVKPTVVNGKLVVTYAPLEVSEKPVEVEAKSEETQTTAVTSEEPAQEPAQETPAQETPTPEASAPEKTPAAESAAPAANSEDGHAESADSPVPA